MGRLDVRVVEARNLPNTQSVGIVDPYVKLTLDHRTHKTTVIENKPSPTWNEVFKFTLADPDSAQLEIEVWNSNVASDDFLGCYSVSLSGMTQGEVKDEWFLLKQCTSNAEIHLRLLPVDFGAVPAPEQLPVEPAVCAPPAPMPDQVPVQQVPPPVQPMQQAPPPPTQQQPIGSYGAPTYGGPPQASGVYGAPVPAPHPQPGYGAPGVQQPPQQPQWGAGPPQNQSQPQWGPPSAPVPGQVVQPNHQAQKKGGGLFGKIGAIASSVVETGGRALDSGHRVVSESISGKTPASAGRPPGAVVGGSSAPHGDVPPKSALWVNQADGFTFLAMDGSLRHIPDANVYSALFIGAITDHAGMNTFSTAPGSPACPFPFGKPIPPFAHLKSCNGEFYFVDADMNGQQVRRHLNGGVFHKYSFMAGQNLRSISLQELQAIPQGLPL